MIYWLFMKRHRILLLAIVAGFVIVLGWLQYRKYQSFGYNGLDLAIYRQAAWSLSHGHGLASSIHDPSYLGDHAEFWLVLIAALYRLCAHPLTLLWAQTLIIASAVWPMTLLVRRYFGERLTPLVGALFLAQPLVYNVSMYEFHGLVFSLPIIFWSIWFYVNSRYWPWVLSLLALLAVREDMALVVFGWAALALIERRPWRWWAPVAVIASGWFVAVQQLIAHANALGGYKYLAFYGWMGNSYAEILAYPLVHPLLFLRHVLGPTVLLKAGGLLLGFGFLPLLGARYLVPVLLIGVEMILLGRGSLSMLKIHYALPYLPFLVWAAIVGWRRLGVRRPNTIDIRRPVAVITLFAGVLYGQLLFGVGQWPWISPPPPPRTDSQLLWAAAREIKPAERVLTTFNLLVPLAGRREAYSLNYVYLGRRQYTEEPYQVPTGIDVAVIDWRQMYDYQFLYRTTLYRGLTGPERIERLLDENKLFLASWNAGVAIYRRTGTDDYQPVVPTTTVERPWKTFGSLALQSPPETGTAQPRTLGNYSWSELSLQMSWQIAEPITKPLSVRYTLTDDEKTVWTEIAILGQGTRPADSWNSSRGWLTNYRLAVPAGLHGQFQFHATILEQRGNYTLNRWRGFQPQITGEEVLGDIDLGAVTL